MFYRIADSLLDCRITVDPDGVNRRAGATFTGASMTGETVQVPGAARPIDVDVNGLRRAIQDEYTTVAT
jgi:hypothetical protein